MPRRSASSQRWLARQRGDAYVKKRQQQGYRSRAAYKLLDLDKRDKLLKSGAIVLDLGAAPGGWTQVAVERVGRSGTVVAVDVLKMEATAGATVITGDCRDAGVQSQVAEALPDGRADLVMCDMAPNISGIAARDEAAQRDLIDLCLEVAERYLEPGGAVLIKLFEFADTADVIAELERRFAEVVRRKPDASRAKSREFYVVAKGFERGITL